VVSSAAVPTEVLVLVVTEVSAVSLVATVVPVLADQAMVDLVVFSAVELVDRATVDLVASLAAMVALALKAVPVLVPVLALVLRAVPMLVLKVVPVLVLALRAALMPLLKVVPVQVVMPVQVLPVATNPAALARATLHLLLPRPLQLETLPPHLTLAPKPPRTLHPRRGLF
jgi:hypothetical protein